MLRSLMIAIVMIATTFTARAGDQQAATWDQWLDSMRPLIAVKAASVQDGIAYRDTTCPAQSSAEKRADCKAKADTFRARRQQEKELVQTMVDAFDNKITERVEIAAALQPILRKMDNETTELGRQISKLYPTRQASAK